MIPASLTWDAVEAMVSDLFGNVLITGAVLFGLAIAFLPRIVGAIKRSASSR